MRERRGGVTNERGGNEGKERREGERVTSSALDLFPHERPNWEIRFSCMILKIFHPFFRKLQPSTTINKLRDLPSSFFHHTQAVLSIV